jgi:hypothetical protein
MGFWAKVRWTDENSSFVATGYQGGPEQRNDRKSSIKTSFSTGTFRGRGINLRGIDAAERERIIDLTFPGWKWTHPHEDRVAP